MEERAAPGVPDGGVFAALSWRRPHLSCSPALVPWLQSGIALASLALLGTGIFLAPDSLLPKDSLRMLPQALQRPGLSQPAPPKVRAVCAPRLRVGEPACGCMPGHASSLCGRDSRHTQL